MEGPDIARLAALIAEPARANMLTALLAIPALTARELADEAGVTAQTASSHLKVLEDAGMISVTPSGRHRYFRLAEPAVGEFLESLHGHAARLGYVRTRVGPKDASLRRARTCYDHMAGEIAVALFERMLRLGFFDQIGDRLVLTRIGHKALEAFGLPEAAFAHQRPSRCCLDWSERRPHLAGPLGAAFLDRILALGWAARDGRALKLSPIGEAGFDACFRDDGRPELPASARTSPSGGQSVTEETERGGLPIKHFADQAAFEAWMRRQPENTAGLWLRLAKIGGGFESSLTKQEAIDVALCHGWIDGQLDTYDSSTWLIRFTPRRPRSKWSAINARRALQLIEAGHMRKAGQAEIDAAKADGRWDAAYASQGSAEVPDDLRRALDANPTAAAFFATLKGANRYAILFRINAVKRADTRARKIADYVAMCERGEVLHPMG